ncbi:MAG: hypothetical protein A2033_05300 [Bacteroidetes bacterium GWA2_31_9]|nr:MAG: hypothetical protein A2033_05300 [Bacteroidetes bacterium GWA2_31_9]
MIKVLLLENEEYYPIATTININGELRPLLYDDGDENPLSSDLIEKFDEILEDKINQAEFRAFAIAYDVHVKRNIESEKTDAIAIKTWHIESEETIIYFYTYKLTNNGIIKFDENWGEIQ